MKFLCRNCKAKYQIADEKVAGRTLRMTCQQCGEPIVVRGPARETVVSKPAAAPAPAAVPAASSTLFGADLTQHLPASARPPASLSDEWHVAINDAPVGPLTREDVARKIAQGVLDRESLAWRDGMDDWLAIKHIADLASLFSAPAKSSQSHGRHAGPSLRAPAARGDLSPLAAAVAGVSESLRAPAIPAAALVESQSRAAARTASSSPRAAGPAGASASATARASEREEPPPGAVATEIAAAAVAIPSVAEDSDSLDVVAETAASPEPGVAAPVPVPAEAPGAPANTPPVTAAPASAAGVSAAPPAVARRPRWAQWFVVGSAVVFALAFGALLGVRFLAPSAAPPATERATAPAPAPAPRPSPKPRLEPEVRPEPRPAVEPTAGPSVIELDAQPIDGAKTARKVASTPRQAPAASTPDKKHSTLTAEDKALLDKMRGDLDHGPTNLRVNSESTRTQATSGTGQLTAEQLSQVVLNGRKNLQRCYETALRGANTNETVRLDVDIQVSPSGNVTSVRTSGKGLPGMDDCIVHTVQMWRFPMSAEATQTRFPVVFQPGA
jgi:rRNA maturation protein Nop10